MLIKEIVEFYQNVLQNIQDCLKPPPPSEFDPYEGIEYNQTKDLRSRIEYAINCESAEKGSETPDWILAEYLIDCLAAYDKAVQAREKWYDREIIIRATPAPETTSEII